MRKARLEFETLPRAAMNYESKLPPLSGDYYAECNELFRSLTDQTEIMLRAVHDHLQDELELNILSVGSGVGLFEIPLLQQLLKKRLEIPLFVGIDNDTYACKIFSKKLNTIFGTKLKFQILPKTFQNYQSMQRFDLILFNHVFEYFADSHLQWINKSLDLRSDAGRIMIFSPTRGGINKIYGDMMRHVSGFNPFFADDIATLLSTSEIAYSARELDASCDISLLEEADEHPDKIKLLSFLTQMDCREIDPGLKAEYSAYYSSLKTKHNRIPHPTTLFVL